MEEIKQLQSEMDALNARLRQSVVKYVESKGTISADEENLGETEQIDVYDKDGVSHEAHIKTVCVSDGALWVSVRDYYTPDQDENVEVSEGMMWAVIQFLDYHKTEQDG